MTLRSGDEVSWRDSDGLHTVVMTEDSPWTERFLRLELANGLKIRVPRDNLCRIKRSVDMVVAA